MCNVFSVPFCLGFWQLCAELFQSTTVLSQSTTGQNQNLGLFEDALLMGTFIMGFVGTSIFQMSLDEHNCSTLSTKVKQRILVWSWCPTAFKNVGRVVGIFREGKWRSWVVHTWVQNFHSFPHLIFQDEGKGKGVKGNLSGKGYTVWTAEGIQHYPFRNICIIPKKILSSSRLFCNGGYLSFPSVEK